MASLFEDVPGMISNFASNTASRATKVTQSVASAGTSNLVLYGLLILAAIVIYLMLTGYKLPSLGTVDIRSTKSKAMDDAHVFWKSGSTGVGNNLRITDDLLPADMNNKYTYHFDLLLTNSRNISNVAGPYRHIFHRGSSDLYNDSSPVALAGPSQPFPDFGLPKRLNPGVFLDPNTNDIIIFVDTKSKTGEVYRESARIADVPLDKPLRLTVTVSNAVLEVDLNCKLELTKVLAGEPKPVENVLYGLCGQGAAEAAIQNLIVWPFALPSKALLEFCPMPVPAFTAPNFKGQCGSKTDTTLMPPTSKDDKSGGMTPDKWLTNTA